MNKILSSADLGHAVQRERKALNKSQGWVGARAQCRRETIGQLESGENVGIHILMAALASMGKALVIVDARPDVDEVKRLFDEDEQD